MFTLTPLSRWLAWISLAGLTACGGGGGGSSSSASAAAPEAVPTSGPYGWLLRAEGATGNLKYGLSLVHRSAPATEFVIEAPTAAVTDSKLIASGTVDAAGLAVGNLNPYALIYIVGGDVRRVPLQANGTLPRSLVQSAQTSSACAFVVDAIDYANPELSRFVVSTAGGDGLCGTSDDGQAEVRLSPGNSGLTLGPVTGATILGVLRDPATLAPRGWIYPTQAVFWASSPAVTLSLRPSGNPLTRVVAATYRTTLVESASGLSLIDFPGPTSSAVETTVAAAAVNGWQSIGYDAQYHYAYTTGISPSGAWQIIRVSRSAPAADVLASGSGQLSVASLGRDYIYITVLGTANNQLLRLNKAVPGATPQTVESTVTSTLSTIVTSGADVHQLWRVTGVGTSTQTYALEMLDEIGSKPFVSSAGGFPLPLAASSNLSFNASENRTGFVLADGYGPRGFGDAVLKYFDAKTSTVRVMGALPGTADYGADFVFANLTGSGPTGLGAGFASRSINGVVQAAGSKPFSFDIHTASSLKFTSQQQ